MIITQFMYYYYMYRGSASVRVCVWVTCTYTRTHAQAVHISELMCLHSIHNISFGVDDMLKCTKERKNTWHLLLQGPSLFCCGFYASLSPNMSLICCDVIECMLHCKMHQLFSRCRMRQTMKLNICAHCNDKAQKEEN